MIMRIILVASFILMTACQHSPRKEYFALNAAAPQTTASSSVAVEKVIGIGPIKIPEYLQYSRISYWKTPLQLTLHENDYWAEPLEQGISRVLRLHVQAAHPQWRIIQYPWSSTQRPRYSLKVDIQRLDAFSDHAIIEAGIDLVDIKNNRVIRSNQFNARVDSTANSAAIAQAFSELLRQTAINTSTLVPTKIE
ncbi:MAG TPA: PqiC family protein [Cellvibrio sp.]|nr:PqiC family protein [Cellvibrio sp.]